MSTYRLISRSIGKARILTNRTEAEIELLHAALLHITRKGQREPILWNIAADIKDKSTPISILEILSQDADSKVRLEVAINPNTPTLAPILEILAQDVNGDIRNMVASNSCTPFRILGMLTQDEHAEVRLVAQERIAQLLRRNSNSAI